jgi:hypothetical protein
VLTRIIGDIHGHFSPYCDVVKNGPEHSIQVGDFGIGFSSPYWHDRVNKFHRENSGRRFIRGNHDDPVKCKTEMSGYIQDGHISGNTMLIGGAWSIDHAGRTEGINWWPDEECSIIELDRLITLYEETKPEIMITHDCPGLVSEMMFIRAGLGLGNVVYKTRTGEALQTMFEIHQPKLHFFGHWHVTKEWDYNGTKFVCLGELDYIDIDLENPDMDKLSSHIKRIQTR